MRLRIAPFVVILLDATCATAMERAIDKQVIVDANVDQVWEAWTTRAGITRFFAPDAEIDAQKPVDRTDFLERMNDESAN